MQTTNTSLGTLTLELRLGRITYLRSAAIAIFILTKLLLLAL